MASGHRPQPLKDVLGKLIGNLGIEGRLEAARVVEAWGEVAGSPIASVTERVWMAGDVLHVKVRSATWRQELFLRRGEWCERLNGHLGGAYVKEIVFR